MSTMFRFASRCFCYHGNQLRIVLHMEKIQKFSLLAYVQSNKLIRIIDESGKNLGLMSKLEAQNIAKLKSLKLTEVAKSNEKIENSVFKLDKPMIATRKHTITKKIKAKELTMKSVIQDADLNVKAKKLQEFLDSGLQVTLIISKPKRGINRPEETYQNLILKLNCSVKMLGTAKKSEFYFRCTVKKDESE